MLEGPRLSGIGLATRFEGGGHWRRPQAYSRWNGMEPVRKKSFATLCPSAQPEADGAAVFAIIQGSEAEPRAAYLNRVVPLSSETAALSFPVNPTEVFRISGPCARNGCQHFRENRCSLVTRLVQLLPSAVSAAPPCAIRPSCVWWSQEGVAACLRCPQVVTRMYGASSQLAEAASPPG